MTNPVSEDFLTPLDLESLQKCDEVCRRVQAFRTEWLILVNIESQKLHLFKESQLVHSYTVSTSAKGAGQEEGSFKTPLGLHQIETKIGEGAHPYALFKARIDTGERGTPDDGTARITTRILRLSGLEEGYNRGKNTEGKVVDSFERYIYIHGTNDLKNLGKPVSKGCICMHPDQMIELFNQVQDKTLVYIYSSKAATSF